MTNIFHIHCRLFCYFLFLSLLSAACTKLVSCTNPLSWCWSLGVTWKMEKMKWCKRQDLYYLLDLGDTYYIIITHSIYVFRYGRHIPCFHLKPGSQLSKSRAILVVVRLLQLCTCKSCLIMSYSFKNRVPLRQWSAKFGAAKLCRL